MQLSELKLFKLSIWNIFILNVLDMITTYYALSYKTI
jgi:hypothetical protein